MRNLKYLFIVSFFILSCVEETPPPVEYTLTTQVAPAGSGTVSPSSGTFQEGTSVTLNASPSSNYNFLKWCEPHF